MIDLAVGTLSGKHCLGLEILPLHESQKRITIMVKNMRRDVYDHFTYLLCKELSIVRLSEQRAKTADAFQRVLMAIDGFYTFVQFADAVSSRRLSNIKMVEGYNRCSEKVRVRYQDFLESFDKSEWYVED